MVVEIFNYMKDSKTDNTDMIIKIFFDHTIVYIHYFSFVKDLIISEKS